MSYKYKYTDDFKMEITADKPYISDLKHRLTVEYEHTARNWKTKRIEKSKRRFRLYGSVSRNTISVPKPLGILLMKDLLESEYKYDGGDKIRISDKWLKIFKNHPYPEKGKLQDELVHKVLNQYYCIASAFTGIGKTECILSIVDSYLDDPRFTGNVVITAFSNSVLEEIRLRAEKYGVKDENRLKLVNPTGYFRSNASKSDEVNDWMRDVDLYIADEGHHFTSLDGTWPRFASLCNPKFLYSFTASADSTSGEKVNLDMLETNTTVQSACFLAMSGEMAVDYDLPVPIRLYTVNCKSTDRDEYKKLKDAGSVTQLSSLFTTSEMAPYILQEVIDQLPRGIVFIPEMSSIETGVHIATRLNQLGVPTVYYSASAIVSPAGVHAGGEIPLSDLKELAKNKCFRVFISNVVGIEGLDLPNINSIIPLSGSSYKNIIQPIGRSARAEVIHCVLIRDQYNPQMNRQMAERKRVIESRLNLISVRKMEISKELK